MYCHLLRIDFRWGGSTLLMTSRVDGPVWIVSIRQRLMPLFNALGRKKVHFIIYKILTVDFQPFHALRTWKVHVVIFPFHQATYFHTLLTPFDFKHVNVNDFWYTMLLIFKYCLPPSTSGMLTHDSTSGVSIRQRPYTRGTRIVKRRSTIIFTVREKMPLVML